MRSKPSQSVGYEDDVLYRQQKILISWKSEWLHRKPSFTKSDIAFAHLFDSSGDGETTVELGGYDIRRWDERILYIWSEEVAKTVSVVIIMIIIITTTTRGWYDYVKWSHSWDNQRISFIDLAMLSRPCIIKNILKRLSVMIMMTIRGWWEIVSLCVTAWAYSSNDESLTS